MKKISKIIKIITIIFYYKITKKESKNNVWVINFEDRVLIDQIPGKNTIVLNFKQTKAKIIGKTLAKANIIVIDNIEWFIKSMSKKKIFLNWHAKNAIKKFGIASLKSKSKIKKYQKLYNKIDKFYYDNEQMKEMLKEAFGVRDDNRFIKTKLLSDKKLDELKLYKEEIKKRYNLENKKIIAYLPTFRPYKFNDFLNLKINDFDNNNKYVIINKYHILNNNKMKNIYDISTSELISICDVLITDYSSVAFDAMYLEKPVIYYVPDFEKYNKEVGIFHWNKNKWITNDKDVLNEIYQLIK